MRSFDYSKLESLKIDMEMINYLSKIHEYKGRQDLYIRQKPAELDKLAEVATIQSTVSSNSIEGIFLLVIELENWLKKRRHQETEVNRKLLVTKMC